MAVCVLKLHIRGPGNQSPQGNAHDVRECFCLAYGHLPITALDLSDNGLAHLEAELTHRFGDSFLA